MGTHPALEYAKRIAYSSEAVLMFSYEMAKKYANSPGIYCECGCAAGAQIIAMAAGAPNKTIYAFDGFCGIPLPSNKDDQMPGIKFLTEAEQKALPNPGEQVLESSGATSVSVKDFANHIKASEVFFPERIFPVIGWFEESIPRFVETMDEFYGCTKGSFLECEFSISILRLDGDLYNSTYVCLKYLYPKVIKGGIVIIDDYALPGCKQAVTDYLSEIGIKEHAFFFIKDENSTVAYWYK